MNLLFFLRLINMHLISQIFVLPCAINIHSTLKKQRISCHSHIKPIQKRSYLVEAEI
jgi:hypothetical protein